MTEEKRDTRNTSRIDYESKFTKTFLVILAALFTFGGPYVVYLLSHLLKNYLISLVAGSATSIIGLVLIWFLIKKKIIS
jgi:hypothetical protein